MDHLRAPDLPKEGFGTCNALAVMAYLLRSIEEEPVWARRVSELLRAFPSSHALTVQSLGAPDRWENLGLWDVASGR